MASGNLMRDLVGPAAAAGPQGRVDEVLRQVLLIDLDKIDDNPFQPRTEMDEAQLRELEASIREHGLLQPVQVRRIDERFQLIYGHRRTVVFRRLRDAAKSDDDRRRFSHVPAEEKASVSDEQMATLALVENLQRADMSPVDAGLALMRLKEMRGFKTVKQVAEATGIKEDRAKRLLRLCDAPDIVKHGVQQGRMVPVVANDGSPVTTESGRERREHRRLDLMSALEFSRLHGHFASTAPKKADEKTEKAIDRALTDGWSFRRIQEHVEFVINGREGVAERRTEAASTRSGLPLFTRDGRRVVVNLGAFGTATSDELRALAEVVDELKRHVQEASARAG